MSNEQGISLSSIPAFPQRVLNSLAQNWIKTVEQFVGACASDESKTHMAAHLSISRAELERLLALATARLHPAEAEKLSRPIDTNEHGLGAKLTEP